MSSMLYIGKDGPFVSDGTRNDAHQVNAKSCADLPVVKGDEEGWGAEHFIDFQSPMTGKDNNVVEVSNQTQRHKCQYQGFFAG